jgi:hypothetical protein
MSEDKWQPIETAPKDGTIILTWQGGVRWRITCYNPHVKEWHYIGIEYSKEAPTYWMPLPQPPKSTKDKCDKCQEEKQVNFRINNYKLCDECIDKELEND